MNGYILIFTRDGRWQETMAQLIASVKEIGGKGNTLDKWWIIGNLLFHFTLHSPPILHFQQLTHQKAICHTSYPDVEDAN